MKFGGRRASAVFARAAASPERWRIVQGILLALVLDAALLLGSMRAVAQVSASLYPDLRALPPTDLILDRRVIGDSMHYRLRFTASIWNAGEGPLELRGESSGDRTRAYQRIYDDQGTFTERLVGEFIYHAGHNHWHFEHFAEYELWTDADYEAWLASGRQRGQPQWRGSKTTGQDESFCVRDSDLIEALPGSPPAEVYEACDTELQGISVGWADTYPFYLAEQWIDLGEAKPADGRYVLRVVADPQNLLFESENGAAPDREGTEANEAVTVLDVQGMIARPLVN
jgi:hypothetical protein